MKKFWLISSIVLLAASCAQKTISPTQVFDYSHRLKVGNKTILVEIADTEQKQTQGLSGRPQLTDNQGMLFNFGTSTMPTFWMKDMKFNLDLFGLAKTLRRIRQAHRRQAQSG